MIPRARAGRVTVDQLVEDGAVPARAVSETFEQEDARGVGRRGENRHDLRTRDGPKRQPRLTRVVSLRTLSTDHGHAALPSATRGYQCDSSSKRPGSPRLPTPRATSPPCRSAPVTLWLDEGSLHIRARE